MVLGVPILKHFRVSLNTRTVLLLLSANTADPGQTATLESDQDLHCFCFCFSVCHLVWHILTDLSIYYWLYIWARLVKSNNIVS